jgi:hypothetical protein
LTIYIFGRADASFRLSDAPSSFSRAEVCAAERAADAQDCPWINAKPSGDLAHAPSDVLGSPDISNIGEVNRYCVEPAQACSYMVGKPTWLGLRERARDELGSRFDIRDFHDSTLLSGCMPLAVLGRVVQDYIRVRRR